MYDADRSLLLRDNAPLSGSANALYRPPGVGTFIPGFNFGAGILKAAFLADIMAVSHAGNIDVAALLAFLRRARFEQGIKYRVHCPAHQFDVAKFVGVGVWFMVLSSDAIFVLEVRLVASGLR